LTVGTGTWKGLPTGIYQGTGPNASRTFNGYNVMAIQSALSTAGIPTTVDGIYGAQTTGNVRIYQTRNGLTVDGIVGPQTWGSMSAFITAAPVFSYAWYTCPTSVASVSSALPAGCVVIAGATQSSYTPTAAEASTYLTAQVTATNSAGVVSMWTISTAGVTP
jgi:peptidoglycan hydrolase-like protein with peptidoglycan-binding domain